MFKLVESLTAAGTALAISTPGYGCGAESLFKMCVGNQLGLELADDVDVESLFTPMYGSFIVELSEDAELGDVAEGVVVEPLGTTVEGYVLETANEQIDLAHLQEAWEGGIESVFSYRHAAADLEAQPVEKIDFTAKDIHVFSGAKIARPRVIIPVFPGNNCEYDTARAFRTAGAEADTFVINNLSPAAVAESTHELARAHPREPDRHDPRRLLRRRRARRLRQVHHRVLPRPRGHRGRSRPAAGSATA